MQAHEKSCEAFVRDGKVYVFANCEIQAGVMLICQPTTVLDLNGPRSAIGAAILAALAAFQKGAPFPEDLDAAALAGLNGTGFKDWKSLSKRAFRLGISSDDARVLVTPTDSDGRQNFADRPLDAVASAPEPSAVAEAFFEAMSRCGWKSRIG